MNDYLLIFAYGITIVASTMAGGYLPQVIRMNHVRMQVVLSFVGGMMLGVALLILLPHGYSSIYKSIEEQQMKQLDEVVSEFTTDVAATEVDATGTAIDLDVINRLYQAATRNSLAATVNSVLIGLLFTFFMMRAFHFHQHGDEDHDDHGHSEGHSHNHGQDDHGHTHHHHDEAPRTKLGWLGVGFGLGLHTFMDGMALGLAVLQDNSVLAGFGVYLAILLHKPLDALSLSTLMAKEKISWRTIQVANACFGLMCLAGAFAAVVLQNQEVGNYWLGCLMAGSAGVFLCISLSDLLPEVQFHRHDRLQLSAALLLGIAVAFIVEWFHQH